MLEWESARYPEGGTYLGPVDFVVQRPGPPVPLARRSASPRAAPRPSRSSAASGACRRAGAPSGSTARWASTTATSPTSCRRRCSRTAAPNASVYNLIYADNIDLFGVSLAKNIGGVSVGAELSYRHNTPLNSQVLGVAPGPAGAGRDQGPARRHHARRWSTRSARCRRRRCSTPPPGPPSCTWSHWTKVTQRRRTCSTPSATRPATPTAPAAPATSTSGTAAPPRTTSASASPSRRPGSRCSRASTCRRR